MVMIFNDKIEMKIMVVKWLILNGIWINKKGLIFDVKVDELSYVSLMVISKVSDL